jgi:DNA-binding GntR family transcriptional regulator
VQSRLAPGARLVEAELALAYGVSRVPLREAFRILATEGLVDLSLHRGATVRPLSGTELQELFGVRMAIEWTCPGFVPLL